MKRMSISSNNADNNQKTVLTIYDVKQFKNYEGKWLPDEGQYINYNSEYGWSAAGKWKVISYNPEVDDYVFSVRNSPSDKLFPTRIFPTGTVVEDYSGQFYGGDK